MANPGNDFTRCLLIAGLGNPGEEYSGTRHNMGFMVVDRLLAKLPKNFEAVHGCSSRYWRGTYAGRTLLLQKPETYMNLSGDAVSALMRREGIEPGEIAVVYDDMDLELGRIRIRRSGSSGGHNGIKSIIGRLGTEAFPRIRIGIGHGESGHGGAPQGGGYSNVPQGGYAPRGQQARPQQYRQAPSQAPAAEDVPQMPIDEPPFETVEGVDDDIPF